MRFSRHYKGAIWTNHALERLDYRGLTQEVAAAAFQNPEHSLPGNQSGSIEYQKTIQGSLVSVVAKKNERNEWLILSCWANPPLRGSDEHTDQQKQRVFKKAGFWKRLFLTLTRQLRG